MGTLPILPFGTAAYILGEGARGQGDTKFVFALSVNPSTATLRVVWAQHLCDPLRIAGHAMVSSTLHLLGRYVVIRFSATSPCFLDAGFSHPIWFRRRVLANGACFGQGGTAGT